MEREDTGILGNHRALQVFFGYVLLVATCYLISGSVLTSNLFRVMVLLLAVPAAFYLNKRPLGIIVLFFIYFNTVVARKAFPVHIAGEIDFLPSEFLFLFGCFLIWKDRRVSLWNLLTASPVRKSILGLFLVLLFCTLWSLYILDLPVLGSWGVVHMIREFSLYLIFFMFLAFCKEEAELRWMLKFFFVLAVLGSVLHIVIFFSKGRGMLAELFPVFLWNARSMDTGTFYGTTTDFLRLNNPATALIRCGLILAVSFYLHTRNQKWKYLALFLLIPVILQFTRMTWIAYLLVIPLFSPIMSRDPARKDLPADPRHKTRWMKIFLIALGVALGIYFTGMVLGYTPFKLFSERFLSVFKGTQESSIGGRLDEIEWILRKVTASPTTLLFGYGVSYMTADSTYFGLLGALGLVGFGAYLWLFYHYVKQGIRIYYGLQKTELKAVCLGSILSVTLAMISGISGNYVVQATWVPTLCLFYAVPELCLRFEGGDGRGRTS